MGRKFSPFEIQSHIIAVRWRSGPRMEPSPVTSESTTSRAVTQHAIKIYLRENRGKEGKPMSRKAIFAMFMRSSGGRALSVVGWREPSTVPANRRSATTSRFAESRAMRRAPKPKDGEACGGKGQVRLQACVNPSVHQGLVVHRQDSPPPIWTRLCARVELPWKSKLQEARFNADRKSDACQGFLSRWGV